MRTERLGLTAHKRLLNGIQFSSVHPGYHVQIDPHTNMNTSTKNRTIDEEYSVCATKNNYWIWALYDQFEERVYIYYRGLKISS